MVDFKTGMGNMEDVLEYLIVPESKEMVKNNYLMKKRTWEYVKVAEEPNESIPKGQRWNNLSKKMNKQYWIITQSIK